MKSADIDEKAIRKEKPEELVVALAEAKVRYHLAVHSFYTVFCVSQLQYWVWYGSW